MKLLWSLTSRHGTDAARMNTKFKQILKKYEWSLMIIHLSFIRNVRISATPSATVTLPFTNPYILTLLTRNSLLSMMIASLTSVIQLSLTYSHVPDEAQINNHQASYVVSIHLIFVMKSNLALAIAIWQTLSQVELSWR